MRIRTSAGVLRQLVPALVLCAIAMGFTGRSFAQERKVIRMEEGAPIIVLNELMVVLAEEDGKVFVKIELPRKPGSKSADEVKLAENDVVLRANGKKIVSIADLKKLYEEAKPGETIKIGVKRGDERFIASFAKADPKDMPEGMMIKTTAVPADSVDAVEKKE